MITHQTNGSIQIPSNIIRDSSISLQQKGLYGIITYYAQLPGFILNRRYICVHHQVGEYTLKSDLTKLKTKKYAACERAGSKWIYSIINKTNEHGYTLIPRTLLSSDITLEEIGLYMVITYTMTLPDVRPGIQLYASYCSDCIQKVKVISSNLQSLQLYKPEKLRIANYVYRLYEPRPDGSFDLLHEVIPASKQKVITISEARNPEHESDPTFLEGTSSSADTVDPSASDAELLENLKKILHYDYFTSVSNPNNTDDILEKNRNVSILDLLLQSILKARGNEYVNASNLKLHYKKYYENYILPLSDTYAMSCLLRSVAGALNRAESINDIYAYITAIIVRNVPYFKAKSSTALWNNYNDDIELYGTQIKDTYMASLNNSIIYDPDTDFFIDKQSRIA